MSNLIIPDPGVIHPGNGYEDKAFIVRMPEPEVSVPLVVSCPHAGILLPAGFQDAIAVDVLEVLQRGDRFTDWLTVTAPRYGAPQVISKVAPAYLNVGRTIGSIHPEDVRGGPGDLECNPDDVYVDKGQGQGLVAMKTLYGNRPIYKEGREPDAEEIRMRINGFYHGFHRALAGRVEGKLADHDYCLIFDVHSCPSVGTLKDPDHRQRRPDLVISNNSEEKPSCDRALVDALAATARRQGFSVQINDPYKGGYVTQLFGAHSAAWGRRNCESLQIEFNRSTFGIDEETLALVDTDKFVRTQRLADILLSEIVAYADQRAKAFTFG